MFGPFEYHIPEGILLTFGEKVEKFLEDIKKIDTKLIAPVILKFLILKSEINDKKNN